MTTTPGAVIRRRAVLCGAAVAVHLNTARALKLTVPQPLLGRADRVIGA